MKRGEAEAICTHSISEAGKESQVVNKGVNDERYPYRMPFKSDGASIAGPLSLSIEFLLSLNHQIRADNYEDNEPLSVEIVFSQNSRHKGPQRATQGVKNREMTCYRLGFCFPFTIDRPNDTATFQNGYVRHIKQNAQHLSH